ncbi:MAG TPA: hypothetical protein VFI27_00580 [candidate division Zixibacteria bacterium]|nr:hypothetical protein [candidate division Zixibacteria bacterium]
MTKSRPIGVTILALLAAVGAIVAIISTLQWFGVSFAWYSSLVNNIWYALMWALMAAIYIWLVRMLWNVDYQGWLFVVVLSTLNLILAFATLIFDSSVQFADIAAAVVVNGLILIYGMLPGTRAAFGPPPGQEG